MIYRFISTIHNYLRGGPLGAVVNDSFQYKMLMLVKTLHNEISKIVKKLLPISKNIKIYVRPPLGGGPLGAVVNGLT